jgi:hypothetical protein
MSFEGLNLQTLTEGRELLLQSYLAVACVFDSNETDTSLNNISVQCTREKRFFLLFLSLLCTTSAAKTGLATVICHNTTTFIRPHGTRG